MKQRQISPWSLSYSSSVLRVNVRLPCVSHRTGGQRHTACCHAARRPLHPQNAVQTLVVVGVLEERELGRVSEDWVEAQRGGKLRLSFTSWCVSLPKLFLQREKQLNPVLLCDSDCRTNTKRQYNVKLVQTQHCRRRAEEMELKLSWQPPLGDRAVGAVSQETSSKGGGNEETLKGLSEIEELLVLVTFSTEQKDKSHLRPVVLSRTEAEEGSGKESPLEKGTHPGPDERDSSSTFCHTTEASGYVRRMTDE
ncbi:hypothetical protein Q8A73_009397 [Channa argus]|nr:hypothetical protein Q8A73_009397 [Channa argus]